MSFDNVLRMLRSMPATGGAAVAPAVVSAQSVGPMAAAAPMTSQVVATQHHHRVSPLLIALGVAGVGAGVYYLAKRQSDAQAKLERRLEAEAHAEAELAELEHAPDCSCRPHSVVVVPHSPFGGHAT